MCILSKTKKNRAVILLLVIGYLLILYSTVIHDLTCKVKKLVLGPISCESTGSSK